MFKTIYQNLSDTPLRGLFVLLAISFVCCVFSAVVPFNESSRIQCKPITIMFENKAYKTEACYFNSKLISIKKVDIE